MFRLLQQLVGFESRLAPRSRLRRYARPALECLEGRLAPASHAYTVPAGDVSNTGSGTTGGLVWAINQANADGHTGTDVINLAAATYSFAAADNDWYGPDALPAIASAIDVEGHGATLTRASTGTATADALRFFYVSGGQSGLKSGSLTLHALTLQDGLAKGGDSKLGGGGAGLGGAIFNQGTLVLNHVILRDNGALGGGSGLIGLGRGGGGVGQDAQGPVNGGGFGGLFPGGAGGAGGQTQIGQGAGGSGFQASDPGQDAQPAPGDGRPAVPGAGGGAAGLGGSGGGSADGSPRGAGGAGGDGGGGGRAGATAAPGASGGAFGFGGSDPNSLVGGGGGGGVGGGGSSGQGGGGGGGFGGGGGGGSRPAGSVGGGSGGFGGGGGAAGAGGGSAGAGGFGAGSGTSTVGGGGAGLGGALFNFGGRATLVNTSFTGNAAVGGNSTGDFEAGSGYGGAVFNLDGTLSASGGSFSGNAVHAGRSGSRYLPDGAAVYNLAFGHASPFVPGRAAVAVATLAGVALSGNVGSFTGDLANARLAGAIPGNGLTQNSANAASLVTLTTRPATGVHDTMAAVSATVNPLPAGGPANTFTRVFFQFGSRSGHYTRSVAVPGTVSGATDTAVRATLTGLTPGTTYYDRVAAVNSATGATSFGNELSFNTPPPRPTAVHTSAAAGTYGVGAVLTITVAFSGPVFVTGTPTLALNSGGTATYAGGSGTNRLTFRYTVLAGQASADLDERSASALAQAGGTVQGSNHRPAVLTLPAPGSPGSLGADADLVIDGLASP